MSASLSRPGHVKGYVDPQANGLWRGAVRSAINGRRGQAFLKEMLVALDSLPEKKLIARYFERNGWVCALGAVSHARGIDMSESDIHPKKSQALTADKFNIAYALAGEIMSLNDGWTDDREPDGWPIPETPAERFIRMRNWVASKIK